ncbi:hypothetical protein NKH77_18690 [Streptomyces sp. M19]
MATSLPAVLDRADKALLVTRSTLLIVALQLVLLAGYALLLVARLLAAERAAEGELLVARGASRGWLLGLAAAEAALLAVPAALAGPLLAGPLMTLLADHGPLARIGLRLDTGRPAARGRSASRSPSAARRPWSHPPWRGRRPDPVRGPAGRGGARAAAGGRGPRAAGRRGGRVLAVGPADGRRLRRRAQRRRRGRARCGPRPGRRARPRAPRRYGPHAAAAAARGAARGTARGGGPFAARRAGRWQLGRRPLRGAGPVLLLVLAVAMGMFALGQGASWDRSQDDQADFAAGAPVRVLGSRTRRSARAVRTRRSGPGRGGACRPLHRRTLRWPRGVRAGAGHPCRPGALLLRDGLADRSADRLLAAVGPSAGDAAAERAGIPLPGNPRELRLTARLTATGNTADNGSEDGSGDGVVRRRTRPWSR